MLPAAGHRLDAVRAGHFEQCLPYPKGQRRPARRPATAVGTAGSALHRWTHVATPGAPPPPARRPPRARGGQRGNASEADATGGHHPGLLSGLAFAGPTGRLVTADGRQGDDGILTALEVAAARPAAGRAGGAVGLRDRAGRTAGGEGLLGLQQAFQRPGPGTLLGSLWQVNDAATSVLMEEFYANLWQKKLPKLEALRQAQLWMLEEGERRDGAGDLDQPAGGRMPPLYWAAFVRSGTSQLVTEGRMRFQSVDGGGGGCSGW